MNFIKIWLLGYTNPTKFIAELKKKTAPHWGLFSTLLRGLMDSVLLYLPIAMMGKKPPTPSYLTFISTATYYETLVWLTPVIFLVEWLIGGVIIHICFRMVNQISDIDQILNITGMSGLVVGFLLLVWDWLWYYAGGIDQYILGISHLVIDIWWFVLVVIGINRVMGISKKLVIGASVLSFICVLPIAMLIMRSPF